MHTVDISVDLMSLQRMSNLARENWETFLTSRNYTPLALAITEIEESMRLSQGLLLGLKQVQAFGIDGTGDIPDLNPENGEVL